MKTTPALNHPLSNLVTLFLASCLVFLVFAMVIYPTEIYAASTEGLRLWFQIVLPAILPFLIVAEVMIGLGLVQFLGKLLEPLMRPLFNIPGPGGFVVAMGFTSGFPIGAVLTSQLRRQNLCTRIEAERLLCFSNNASPLFMLVAIPVGMFGQPSLGIALAAVHYSTNLLIGMTMRFYRYNDPENQTATFNQLPSKNISAWKAMVEARQKDGRTLGKLLGDAVRLATTNLLVIGGFIVFFSVLMKVLGITGIIALFVKSITTLLPGIPADLVHALTVGFGEITLGCQAATQAILSLELRLAIVGAILGWNGIAIHAQIAGMIADTDIRFTPFILARLAHAILSGLILYKIVRLGIIKFAEPVWSPLLMGQLSFGNILWNSSQVMLVCLLILLLIGLLTTITNQIRTSLVIKK